MRSPLSGRFRPLLGAAEPFCSRFPVCPFSSGRAGVSYNLAPDSEYQLLQLILYVMSFLALILIFLYIAAERPAEKKKKEEEDED